MLDCISNSPSWTRSSLSSLVTRRGKMRSSEYIPPNIPTQHGSWSQMLSTGVVLYLMISSSTMFLTDSSPCSPLVGSVSPSQQLLKILLLLYRLPHIRRLCIVVCYTFRRRVMCLLQSPKISITYVCHPGLLLHTEVCLCVVLC